jgi:endoglucanase
VRPIVTLAAARVVDRRSVNWLDRHARAVANTWGMTCAIAAGEIRCRGVSWADTNISPDGSVTVGVQVTGDGIAPGAPVLMVG